MNDPRRELYKTKLTLLAILLGVAGLALMIVARVVFDDHGWHWLQNVPLDSIGSTLFIAGLLSVAMDYFDGRDREARDTERLQRVLRAEAPAIRDAVIQGFAFEPDDLARVSTPQTLDQIIQNSLAIRLGDKVFADELYTDIRDQAVRSVERWHDAKIRIRLSADRSAAGSSAPPVRTGSASPDRLIITVRQEYTTIPANQTRRFASTSDSDEYRELTQDGAATFVWFTKPGGGVDAGSTDAFELVQFSVNGAERPIRRSARKGGQLYTVSLGIPESERHQPVTLAFTYRLIPPAHNRWLHFDVEQPTRGIDVEFDYSDTDIAQVSMLDLIASSQKSIVTKTPPTIPGKAVGLEFDGWLMPKSGVVFVWTMAQDISANG